MPQIKGYVHEIRQFVAETRQGCPQGEETLVPDPGHGQMILGHRGQVAFDPPDRKADFDHLLGGGRDYFQLIGYTPALPGMESLQTLADFLNSPGRN
jgi:hypothetical protein